MHVDFETHVLESGLFDTLKITAQLEQSHFKWLLDIFLENAWCLQMSEIKGFGLGIIPLRQVVMFYVCKDPDLPVLVELCRLRLNDLFYTFSAGPVDLYALEIISILDVKRHVYQRAVLSAKPYRTVLVQCGDGFFLLYPVPCFLGLVYAGGHHDFSQQKAGYAEDESGREKWDEELSQPATRGHDRYELILPGGLADREKGAYQGGHW